MFGAIASLVITSAKDLCLFRVERVRLLPKTGHFFLTRVLLKEININMLTWIGCVALQKILALAHCLSFKTNTTPISDLVPGCKYWSCA